MSSALRLQGSFLNVDQPPYHQLKTVFGISLCYLFYSCDDRAPQLLLRCVRELESRARSDLTLDLYQLYQASPPVDQYEDARRKLQAGCVPITYLLRSINVYSLSVYHVL